MKKWFQDEDGSAQADLNNAKNKPAFKDVEGVLNEKF
jgi:hypothetical protein